MQLIIKRDSYLPFEMNFTYKKCTYIVIKFTHFGYTKNFIMLILKFIVF
jgi:hypothetical protein